MNPGGGSGRDEPPLDIQIPDDARELDRDVLAYRREQRARRRRTRRQKLTAPFGGTGTVMPLLASILAVCLVAGAMLSVATFGPGTAPATHPPAHGHGRLQPSVHAAVQPAEPRAVQHVAGRTADRQPVRPQPGGQPIRHPSRRLQRAPRPGPAHRPRPGLRTPPRPGCPSRPRPRASHTAPAAPGQGLLTPRQPPPARASHTVPGRDASAVPTPCSRPAACPLRFLPFHGSDPREGAT